MNYVTRFAEKLDGLCSNLTNAPSKDLEKIKKLLTIWKSTKIFDEELIQSIQNTHFAKAPSQNEEPVSVPATYVPPEETHAPALPNLIASSIQNIQNPPMTMTVPSFPLESNTVVPSTTSLSNLAPPPALAQLFGLSANLNPVPSGPQDPNEFDYDDDDDGSNSRPNLSM